MNAKDCLTVLNDCLKPTVIGDEKQKEAIELAESYIKAMENIKELVFKYRCSAVTIKNQKTYFTEHDIGYCKGALDVFEEVQMDIEGITKKFGIM